MTKVALVVIYNHRYDRNIDIVERIHGGRFSHIFHLMPFYDGDRANVIPVYENSYYFQGYVAQAWRALRRDDFTHYFFIADDLVLNPSIDERNFLERMGLPDGRCYIPSTCPFHRRDGYWGRAIMAYEWQPRSPGIEAVKQLPSRDEALALLRRHRIEVAPVAFEQLWETPETWRDWLRRAVRDPGFCLRYLKHRVRRETYELPYPMVGGYSDIFVVTADVMPRFAHLCGVLSATRLFVEHAIPTAMALSADAITTDAGLKLRGAALWTAEQMRVLEPYHGSLRALLEGFPAHNLFLHPIKFTRWVDDLDSRASLPMELEHVLLHPGRRNQVEGLELLPGALRFRSTGNDPYLCLPPVPLEPGRPAWVHVNLTVPTATCAQLYYLRPGQSRYSEDASVRQGVRQGRHDLVFVVDDPGDGELRIDPGGAPGEYQIHSVRVVQ